MTKNNFVADDQIKEDVELGRLYSKQLELARRVREGTLPNYLVLKELQKIIDGEFLPIIDCDTPVFAPNGWGVLPEEQLPNRIRGKFRFNPYKIKLYLTDSQKGDRAIRGNNLREELKMQRVLSVNVLDYLLENQYLIPEKWKGEYIFFWGTIYRSLGGERCVRCLVWRDRGWYWGFNWLEVSWGRNMAACLSDL